MARKLTAIVEARVTLAFSLLVLLGAYLFNTLEPTPYRDVELVRYSVENNEIRLVANFTKTDCEFQRLRVVAATAGETEFLRWRDLDGLPQDHDRNAGQQTLRIAIKLERSGYDWVEVRTRHDCDGHLVDRVFLHMDNVP
ncbi:MAG: hypothetical protein ACPG6L_11500 [Nereida ignava]